MDPIANLLSSINNASRVGRATLDVPFSRLKLEIAKTLVKSGLLTDVGVKTNDKGHKEITLTLMYQNEEPTIKSLRRISRPGLRVYKKSHQMPRLGGRRGVVVVSTPQGIMSGDDARRLHLGGEVLCEVMNE